MPKASSLRHRLVAAALLAAAFVFMPMRAHAASKEIIALQTQVQQLLDMVQRMQSTLDQKFGVLQHLVEQTADNANQMTQTVNSLQQKLNQQNEALSGKVDTASGQVQSLNDSVDELKTRIAKLDKSIQDLQGQLQNIQAAPAGTQPGVSPTGTPEGGVMPGTAPGAINPPTASAAPAPPLKETFQGALRDYNAAKYPVATGEFQDVIHYYPMDDLAGSAQFRARGLRTSSLLCLGQRDLPQTDASVALRIDRPESSPAPSRDWPVDAGKRGRPLVTCIPVAVGCRARQRSGDAHAPREFVPARVSARI